VISRSGYRSGIALGALVTAGLMTAAACSVGVSGSAPESSDGGDDATASEAGLPSDAGPADARADTGVDSGRLKDSGTDSGDGAADAGCPGVICNGQCTTADDCAGCSGAPLLCAPKHACVSSCGTCGDSADASLPIECFACDTTHQNPIGTCNPDAPTTYCLAGTYFGTYHGGAGYRCACADGEAGACPGANQVCTTLGSLELCAACGEILPTSIAGLSCKQSGTTCNPTDNACQ
jgi:hypothetical protein